MLSKKYSIIVVPEDNEKVVNRQLSRGFIISVIAIALSFFVVSAYFAVGFLNSSIDSRRMTELTTENGALASKITELENTVYSLRGEMSGIIEKDDNIRLIFDLPPIDPDLREVGVGGEAVNYPTINSGLGQRTWLVEDDIEKIQRQLEFENASFERLLSTVKERKSKLDHTPTIRPCDGILSRGFGMHNDPFTGSFQPHNGIDIAASRDTPVLATAGGIVRYTGHQTKLGNTVVIDHGNGIRTYYGHLNKIKVRKGQRISRRDLVGLVGSSGYSTGPHLHYEVRIAGRAVNPYKYIITSILS